MAKCKALMGSTVKGLTTYNILSNTLDFFMKRCVFRTLKDLVDCNKMKRQLLGMLLIVSCVL